MNWYGKRMQMLLIGLLVACSGFSCQSLAPENGATKEYEIKAEGPWDYITQKDLEDMGMANHDAPMSFIRLGKNEYWIYLSEGGREQAMHANVKRIRTTVSGIEKSTAEDVPIHGIPDARKCCIKVMAWGSLSRSLSPFP